MAIGWDPTLSALIFCIGAVGVITRPNPLVILLCLELMLNAGNLALFAFSRMWGHEDGQIFALIVMVVAACEVTVGLGLIVAIYRRQLPVNVDDLNELSGGRGRERNDVRLSGPALPPGGDDPHRPGVQAAARHQRGLAGDAGHRPGLRGL